LRAVLLAAGFGTRLAPLTNTVPKCLVPIAGRPLLDYWLEMLCNAGITDILINLHYLPERVREYLAGTSYPANIVLVQEDVLLGTAGTILKNRDFIDNGSAIVAHADNLSVFDPKAFVHRFETRDADIDMTMMTFHTDAPQTCGIVELNDRGTVTAFHEKKTNPPGNLANAAVYIVSPAVVAYIASLGKEQIDFSTEVLPHFMGRINTYSNTIYHRDIGTPESLSKAQADFPIVMRNLDARPCNH